MFGMQIATGVSTGQRQSMISRRKIVYALFSRGFSVKYAINSPFYSPPEWSVKNHFLQLTLESLYSFLNILKVIKNSVKMKLRVEGVKNVAIPPFLTPFSSTLV
jgi:hypothetical protein